MLSGEHDNSILSLQIQSTSSTAAYKVTRCYDFSLLCNATRI
jgi:hypothetical protein